MATLFKPRAEQEPHVEGSTVSAFLRDLDDLSRRHGIAISDGAELYLMEQEDYARSYLADDESQLSFA